uniref:Uncharacterized protein n=1 Tax=Candidatus Enterococcus clewellii TaxID=1834193 RepID=A0A242JX47_9ENTE|nr:hypothetical protein A5888_004086 [Enterococcus sp. 9E7_DIV0242]
MEEHVQAMSLEVSQMLTSLRTSCDGEGNNSTEVPDVTLPRKASSEKTTARTVNRHR